MSKDQVANHLALGVTFADTELIAFRCPGCLGAIKTQLLELQYAIIVISFVHVIKGLKDKIVSIELFVISGLLYNSNSPLVEVSCTKGSGLLSQ